MIPTDFSKICGYIFAIIIALWVLYRIGSFLFASNEGPISERKVNYEHCKNLARGIKVTSSRDVYKD